MNLPCRNDPILDALYEQVLDATIVRTPESVYAAIASGFAWAELQRVCATCRRALVGAR